MELVTSCSFWGLDTVILMYSAPEEEDGEKLTGLSELGLGLSTPLISEEESPSKGLKMTSA